MLQVKEIIRRPEKTSRAFYVQPVAALAVFSKRSYPMSKQITLTQGKFTIVDDEDFEWLNQWKWCANKIHNIWYAIRGLIHSEKIANGKHICILMHRQIMNCPKGFEIDHQDHNGLNNQKSNLRICTRNQNQHNQKIQTRIKSSQFKGVYWDKSTKRWPAQIKYNSKRIHLGGFGSEIEAAKAYDKAAKRLFGEFARLNLPVLKGEK